MEALKLNYASAKLDDLEVVRRVLAGEKMLFEILLRRHNQKLYRIIRSYLKNDSEVEDAMQNTYLKAFDKLSQFQGNASFSTWLIKIGINEALIRLNTMKKERLLYLNTEAGQEVYKATDRQLNPERQIIYQESQRMLEHAIDNLPEKYRVIYVMKEIEGLSNEEISGSLDLGDSNIKVRLHRAKALLKDNLFALSSTAEVFEFGSSRCDAMVRYVMNNIQ